MCWVFCTRHQKKLHESYSHICTDLTKIANERAFLFYVKTYDKQAPIQNLVQLFHPLDNRPMAELVSTFYMPQTGQPQGENKTRVENNGKCKGMPPFLNKPLVPFTLLKQKTTPVNLAENMELDAKARKQRMLEMPLKQLSQNEDADLYIEGLTEIYEQFKQVRGSFKGII